jgi:nanoRNase/pAp phosphatase (c-di-AMP/oligoRNAs hydrolase)
MCIRDRCLSYGGGGHLNAGTCQVDNDQAESALAEIVEKINADG